MNLVVADHHHDPDAGVYRLIIGEVVEREQYVVDETGAVMLDDLGQPLVETVSEIVPIEDVVFADDDKRWSRKGGETIAAEQRQLVAQALADRAEPAQPDATPPTQLPGVGRTILTR
jgi:hypothetical protein